MATEIRHADRVSNDREETLEQVREVFSPAWIQFFDNSRVLISFHQDPAAETELIRFMEINGYELCNKSAVTWTNYKFEPSS